MGKYPLHDLGSQGFEDLVVSLCHTVLGTGTISFSTGKDGGRDAKFIGKANYYPSMTDQWNGKFIIQAKHISRPNASCSDSDFPRIIQKELSKIKRMVSEKKLDYYLLFTNRKLSGIQDSKIEDMLKNTVGINKYALIADETIQGWLREYPGIVKANGLSRLLLPLQFYENDLREVILTFAKNSIDNDKINDIDENWQKITLEEKNKLNGLSKEYFENCIKKNFSYFSQISEFLKDPKNDEYKNSYLNRVDDINEKITIKRDEYGKFEEIIGYLYDSIFDESNIALRNNSRFIRVFLHYMYANCDIGRKV